MALETVQTRQNSKLVLPNVSISKIHQLKKYYENGVGNRTNTPKFLIGDAF